MEVLETYWERELLQTCIWSHEEPGMEPEERPFKGDSNP